MPNTLELANAIRFLAIDAVEKSQSGHPGAPMGMAEMATVLWRDVMRHNPKDPKWPNRDRFILSNGHASMLLYSLLHLTGYDVTLDDIKDFRQLHSKTPGHPEVDETPGVETTTGPLGQGIANAVGMALAEAHLAATFNQKDFPIIDHFTYVFLGDGCLMEGISHEVCSFAGTLGLGKLICFWDDNGISIDGKVEPWFSDNTAERFQAYNWQVIADIDGHDPAAISNALKEAQNDLSRPTLICCKTHIGKGAPNLANTAKCHGAPLGNDEIAATRAALNWPHEAFHIPEDIYASWDCKAKGQDSQAAWQNLWNDYEKAHPTLAQELERRLHNKLPENWQTTIDALIQSANAETGKQATRKASQFCLDQLVPKLPELLGGSADLTGSNNTKAKDTTSLTKENIQGNYIHYGVREFGMSAITNGMALYGGVIPFTGTFLTFSDYARNAVRMAALMRKRNIFVYSHDSIGLGEDGPTHQSVEHAASLRLIPNLNVWRPCDITETAVAWQSAIEATTTPSALLLTRQGVAYCDRSAQQIADIRKGGYVLLDCAEADALIIATGSEVGIALEAANELNNKGARVRVVSMPCVELFLQQDNAYQESVLPPQINKRLAIEAGVSQYWQGFVGTHGKVIGIDSFGLSAPAGELMKLFGFTKDNILKEMLALV